ncbi:extracellular solute-binding protein [Oscillatoria sp. FACHB-1406]|uniref:extracellular solute-binding protein n=1 Tax=Oscillatoria sp. FACHB-1406 TaxID=2692846 RepID=UPI001686CBF0|nr:extracellular solute-binding protein [Oscillatoria sp. FACHB-1406]MBD2580056.1 extracellular solute-binding protein [Oscillatoria sp. FACHB-1406]
MKDRPKYNRLLSPTSSLISPSTPSLLSRRSLLQGVALAAISPLFSSCGERETDFHGILLANSLPPQLISSFRNTLERKEGVNFTAEAQLKDLFELLKVWKEGKEMPSSQSAWWKKLPLPRQKISKPADIMALGHYELSEAIAKQYIQPLALESLKGWQQVPENMKALVTRDKKVWGAPYRWGTTAIAYNRDRFEKLGWTPKDWNDLWRQELQDRIAIVDQPREVIGLTLKALGYSYNERNPRAIASLKTHLANLHQQIKFYSSRAYLQPLVLKDVWVAVGWSSDIAPIVEQYPYFEAVIPQSGTALWADLWVKPVGGRDAKDLQSLRDRWIDFCWQEKAAQQISLFTTAASPTLLGRDRKQLPPTLQKNSLILPKTEIIRQSEFILPLPPESLKQYDALWKEMRATQHS